MEFLFSGYFKNSDFGGMQDSNIYITAPTDEFHTSERCHITEIFNQTPTPETSIARARVEAGVTTENHLLRGTAIYRVDNRLYMIVEATDAANPKVQERETLMWTYQQALPPAQPGEKWVLMERIFRLT